MPGASAFNAWDRDRDEDPWDSDMWRSVCAAIPRTRAGVAGYRQWGRQIGFPGWIQCKAAAPSQLADDLDSMDVCAAPCEKTCGSDPIGDMQRDVVYAALPRFQVSGDYYAGAITSPTVRPSLRRFVRKFEPKSLEAEKVLTRMVDLVVYIRKNSDTEKPAEVMQWLDKAHQEEMGECEWADTPMKNFMGKWTRAASAVTEAAASTADAKSRTESWVESQSR
ncbi:hypothetical protein DL770_007829 [Monosporascus sp. CRB-9-2]|nr:hypothetical protein DL770_007829 [Monosporascus sp. CRB-9-2]